MQLGKSFLLALSMFSRIPVPETDWTAENRKYALMFLPAVGVAIGLVLFVFSLLAKALSFGTFLTAAGYALLPLTVSGGIHLDGFADTVDALSSRADADKKRAILKDPHTGAFAVIATAAYLICYFAACTELPASVSSAIVLTVVHTLSRVSGALAVTAFSTVSKDGLAAAFSEAPDKRLTLGVLAAVGVFFSAFLVGLSPLSGLAALCAGAACIFFTHRMAEKEFGGMSGDIAGYLITVTELAMLLAFVIFYKAVAA